MIKNAKSVAASVIMTAALVFIASIGAVQAQDVFTNNPESNLVLPQITAGANTSVNINEQSNNNEQDNELKSKDDSNNTEFTKNFFHNDCTFSSTGKNPYFVLEPNYQLVLAGTNEDGEDIDLTITVLDQTKEVNGTETRIVEERELKNGNLIEISLNYFAVCNENNSIFYFGEDVDNYENDQVVNHTGSWLAGENGNMAGIIMPGTLLTGGKYYQEIAEGIAMDRAEIMDINQSVKTPAGIFDTVVIRETTPLEPDALEFKYHARGIGLIQDNEIKLQNYGFINE